MSELDQAINLLLTRAGQLAVTLTPDQVEQIKLYCTELAQYNEHTNLVSDASPEVLALEHILDSLTLVKFLDEFKRRKRTKSKTLRLIDIGSGAGLPGLIVSIALPYLQVVLVDSVGKKVRFQQQFIERAGLQDRVTALNERAEEMAHHLRYREQFDAATCRAVGSFEVAAELAMPFLKLTGELYVQKSLGQLDDASRHAARALPKLGGAILEATVLDSRILGKERVVMVAEKRTKTAPLYPRNWAQMKSNPLAQ